MVIMDELIFFGCVILVRFIGMLEMIDGGDRDEKIFCVLDKDLCYIKVKFIKDVVFYWLEEIVEFFRIYKNLEKKVIEIFGWKDVD